MGLSLYTAQSIQMNFRNQIHIETRTLFISRRLSCRFNDNENQLRGVVYRTASFFFSMEVRILLTRQKQDQKHNKPTLIIFDRSQFKINVQQVVQTKCTPCRLWLPVSCVLSGCSNRLSVCLLLVCMGNPSLF